MVFNQASAVSVAPLWPSCFTARLSWSYSMGFLMTVTGPWERMRLRISLSAAHEASDIAGFRAALRELRG